MLCFSVLVVVLDTSILNVAIPTIVRELDASNSDLQWMVDSYVLVFAGLLLTAGGLGDRFGRRRARQVGFVLFGLGSLAAALASGAGQIIVCRSFMGIGAALVMPATLSIITNVFPAEERGRAIAVWAATAGVAGALGSIAGGFLLEHFYWGSVFMVNVPIVALGLLAGVFLIPDSKDPSAPRLDPLGALVSIAALASLVYAIIEAPARGWTDPTTLSFLGLGVVLVVVFVAWELHTDHPMLDVRFFANPRFSAASGAIMVTFFGIAGMIFLITQYMQSVLGLSALAAGARMLALALSMVVFSLLSPKLVARAGTKVVVVVGLALTVLSFASMVRLDQGSSSLDVMWRLALVGAGLALTSAPATESIMGSLPLAKAGVGSAMNDTTRQVGGAVGVAVMGSVLASIDRARVADAVEAEGMPETASRAARESLGAALAVASRAPGALRDGLTGAARLSYVDGFHYGMAVAAGVVLLGGVVVAISLPAQARDEDLERQASEFAAGRERILAAHAEGERVEPLPAPVSGS